MIPMQVALTFAEYSYENLTVRVGEAECWCTTFDEYQIVCPRGTEADGFISQGGWLDIIADLALWPWYHRHIGWSHYGMQLGAKMLVKHGLRGLLRKDEPIILIGHSLGGGYALNCALFLSALGFDVKGVITFGSPKALYSDSALTRLDKRNIKVWQFINENDLVTKVPAVLGQHVNPIETEFKGGHGLDDYREALKGYEGNIA